MVARNAMRQPLARQGASISHLRIRPLLPTRPGARLSGDNTGRELWNRLPLMSIRWRHQAEGITGFTAAFNA